MDNKMGGTTKEETIGTTRYISTIRVRTMGVGRLVTMAWGTITVRKVLIWGSALRLGCNITLLSRMTLLSHP
jgi:hypothetical protein